MLAQYRWLRIANRHGRTVLDLYRCNLGQHGSLARSQHYPLSQRRLSLLNQALSGIEHRSTCMIELCDGGFEFTIDAAKHIDGNDGLEEPQ
jgi:hypothetical protein